jgi:hypothetical protein
LNVVTPDELIMQKYWPAQEAVAKLRREATFLELRALQTHMGTVIICQIKATGHKWVDSIITIHLFTATFTATFISQRSIYTYTATFITT